MYNKKILKYFKNPKHAGRIKNPDGIGEVINRQCGDSMRVYIKIKDEKISKIRVETLGCLPSTEELSLGNEWKPISALQIGEEVLNGEGEKVKVKEFYEGFFDGKLILITPFVSKFNGFYVTPTHPIFCIKRKFLKNTKIQKKCSWLQVNAKELNLTKPCFLDAEYLEEGDYLVFPKRKKIVDDQTFTKDLMKLIGYYLAEGYVTSKGTVINFAFNKNERNYITETKSLLKKIINKEGSERTRNNVTELRICSTRFAEFLIKTCGKYAKQKKLSEKILLLPFEKQWEMIKTYINGDGNIYKRRPKDSLTYRVSTSSRKLAIQIQEILARGNIFASIRRCNLSSTIIEGRKILPHILFQVSFKLEKKHNFVKENEKYFFVPIKKIERKSFRGKIYNIKVKGKINSYLVRGFIVHNCVAAISSSEALAELVEGKSLNNALKIKKEDIIKKLGGKMPAEKVHCSVLAQDGLKKAIESYFKKHS